MKIVVRFYQCLIGLTLLCISSAPEAVLSAPGKHARKGASSKSKKLAVSRFEQIGKSPSPTPGHSWAAGKLLDTFPDSLSGNWGGKLEIWNYQNTPLYFAQDRAEAIKAAELLKRGRSGTANFNFVSSVDGKLEIEPVRVLLYVPLNESHSFNESLRKGTFPANLPHDLQRMGALSTPISIIFGSAKSTKGESGVTGNQFAATTFKQQIREIDKNVYEYQFFDRTSARIANSNKLVDGSDETVYWLKPDEASGTLFVRLATVKYNNKGQCLSTLIMTGTLKKGATVEVKPHMPNF